MDGGFYVDEREKLTRERNKNHSKKSRERKKALVNNLKKKVCARAYGVCVFVKTKRGVGGGKALEEDLEKLGGPGGRGVGTCPLSLAAYD